MILVAGSANIDFITRVAHIPVPGETVLGQTYLTAAGGKGANQAVAAARAGAPVEFLGALGADHFAELIRDSLRLSGVGLRTMVSDQPTGAAFISVSDQGENAITVSPGANTTLQAKQLGALGAYRYLVLQLEIPLEVVQYYAQSAKAQGVTVILNASPAQPLAPELLAAVDILVVNQGELAQYSGKSEGLEQQLRQMQARGPQTITVTLGAQGSLTLSGHEYLETPAFAVPVVDTTGAGDTFVGVLAALLDEGASLPEALHHASAGAAIACTRVGAQPSMPTRAEIEALVAGR